ncbi:hypothetical protein [Saccharospirillum salsuginis]|uniref:Uncharacterized protein n=1 Tax=Saccharospirillum salsuginis TaxID=418750 RepID=A0A918KAA0_9GAMM|nr:hypothetical protein [Saccharospirillum salsuginis]GGX54663.1 hypothetical protein GCM10007392_22620 [Saccharospirillum salsuginis]
MSVARDPIVFMRNPKVSKMAKIQVGLGFVAVAVSIFVLAAGMPVAMPLAAGLIMIVTALILLSREETPVCTITHNALEFKNPAPLGSLQLVPLNSIRSVSRQKRRFIVETSHQRKPVNLPIELFKPEEVEDLWSVLNDLVKPQYKENAQ